MHVFRVMISCFLAIETVLLMDMANTAFFGYYMCALAQSSSPLPGPAFVLGLANTPESLLGQACVW